MDGQSRIITPVLDSQEHRREREVMELIVSSFLPLRPSRISRYAARSEEPINDSGHRLRPLTVDVIQCLIMTHLKQTAHFLLRHLHIST